MIAKGNLHAHGQKLAFYLITGKDGERAELVELKGFASSNIFEAFTDVQIAAAATRCEKPFFHAHVRLPEGEALSREQWLYVADRLEKQLGFEGQGRAVAFHEDLRGGEKHLHVAWSRIDLEQMRAIDPGLYKNKLKEVCRQLERELGLTRVRNERAPEHKTRSAGRNEFEQSRRLGTDIRAIREDIRSCWERSDSGRSFEAALAERGYVLARGNQRDFVIVDPAGGDHALGKRITGATAAETRARLADIDKRHLPSVGQAKALQAARDAQRTPARGLQVETTASIVGVAARVETREGRVASSLPGQEKTPSQPPGRDAGVRRGGDVAGSLAGSVVRTLGALFDSLADMISAPTPLSPEQQERADQAAEERAVVEQEKAAKAEADAQRLQEMLDTRTRLEEQLKADLENERRQREQEDGRGRER